MKNAFSSVDIEKNIKSKIGKPMTKGSFDLCIGYLGYRHQRSIENRDEEGAKIYLDFMDVVQKNYDKFKNQKVPFVLDEGKVIDYLN